MYDIDIRRLRAVFPMYYVENPMYHVENPEYYVGNSKYHAGKRPKYTRKNNYRRGLPARPSEADEVRCGRTGKAVRPR